MDQKEMQKMINDFPWKVQYRGYSEEEDGFNGYTAFLPSFNYVPICGDGDTKKAALENLKSYLPKVLAYYIEDGKKIPKDM